MPIKVLSPEVVSKIAAGEVVERPSSVVKELIENSLDAAATQVMVEVVGGGVQLLRVADNGMGIPADEVELAFKRYATSKLSTISDLEEISSLGFRGEALPSIAAVVEVSMVSRGREELGGTFIYIKNGSIVGKTKRGCPIGTTITVRNLFRNFPARLKFLKSGAAESRHISHLVTQYSLAFPEVRFTLIVDGRTVFRSPGNGSLRDVLIEVYGVEAANSLLELKGESILGFISPPRLSRSNRSYLSFFINRRWVNSRLLSYAVEEAYRGVLMTGKHPIAVVNILLPPQEVDVNIHPTKREVRFRREHEVFSMVHKAVRTTLLEQAPVPFLSVGSFSNVGSQEKLKPMPFQKPFSSVGSQERLASSPFQKPFSSIEPQKEPSPALKKALPILRVLGQLQGAYIIAEGPDGMYLIDQHAAHERVLFERLRGQQMQQKVEVQGLLEPVMVELTMRQDELLKSQQKALAEYGFAIEAFGERSYLIRSVPALLSGRNIAQSLLEVLDSLIEGAVSDWREGIAISLACHGAVRAGQVLSQQEMEELVQQLEQTRFPRACPHGRPTMLQLSSAQLEKEFGRI